MHLQTATEIRQNVPTENLIAETNTGRDNQTVMAGALYGVNPFGQPGVEAGKNATYALMGRGGYEGLRDELQAVPADADRYRLTPA